MDPNEVLRKLLEMVAYYDATGVPDCQQSEDIVSDCIVGDYLQEMVGHVRSLDGWLSTGGFLPDAWSRDPLIRARNNPLPA